MVLIKEISIQEHSSNYTVSHTLYISKIYGDDETVEMQEEIAQMREHILNEVS